jgi:hypothetical protein
MIAQSVLVQTPTVYCRWGALELRVEGRDAADLGAGQAEQSAHSSIPRGGRSRPRLHQVQQRQQRGALLRVAATTSRRRP